MELDVQRAKELIEQKLAEEEEEEEKKLKRDGAQEPPAVERMSTPDLEEEKRRGPRNWGLEAVKGQERVRKSSVDLRREIIDVGSIQRLIELRKQRRQRREERAATPEPPPPPETLEIEGDTALHDATRLSRYKIIKMLILHGADMMAKNQVSRARGQHWGHLLPHRVTPPWPLPLSAHSCRLARPRQTWCSSGKWTHVRRWRPRSSHRGRWKCLHDSAGGGTRLQGAGSSRGLAMSIKTSKEQHSAPGDCGDSSLLHGRWIWGRWVIWEAALSSSMDMTCLLAQRLSCQ
ncbi:ankyrin repeat domain-containing protein 2 isoform X4 [Tyto alba]|uniref:ankyrin repeat domain-containing protein 2 isoform X4 n=1 Tax=Tyto alba TaxID=56313 RepID=UPI001C6662B6|nr:ankyrin repeat domain-containing protein 2 isoform X4 [Tyto alba]